MFLIFPQYVGKSETSNLRLNNHRFDVFDFYLMLSTDVVILPETNMDLTNMQHSH